MMRARLTVATIAVALSLLISASSRAAEKAPPNYEKVAPVLRRYCAGCHNEDDRDGGLALNTYKEILKGGEHGAVVTPRRGDLSRLVRVLNGQSKLLMPPEGEARPSSDEIALLKAWIDAGAKGPKGGEPDPTVLVTPTIKPKASATRAVNAVALSPDQSTLAIARYGVVELVRFNEKDGIGESRVKLGGHRGNVNDVQFSKDGAILVAASGEVGLFGEVRIWDVKKGRLIKVLQGHKDAVYAAAPGPNGSLLASGSYDKSIVVWDVQSGKPLRTLTGHNAAVYDVAFHPGGKILASASGDRTVKLWNVDDGSRLDTFGQSLKELYALSFSPDGRRLAAGGVDNRIRVWRISETGREGTNPLLLSIFAHDAPILRLDYSGDGRRLVSSGEDGRVKIWNARSMGLRSTLPRQPDWAAGLAITDDAQFVVAGRLDGSLGVFDLARVDVQRRGMAEQISERSLFDVDAVVEAEEAPHRQTETEPNDEPSAATALTLPAAAKGKIHRVDNDTGSDVDLYSFSAKKGDTWIVEINAARAGSPLDSKIAILHEDGTPVQKLLLRAVRDSEITFRGINSEQLNCRVTNWEEMELNQYLYIAGEVVKLYRAPRGPDSGFNFYPNSGKRFCYFDTSARSYPLFQTCYIVVPYPMGSEFPDNGLPVIPLFYENDDESQQKLGKDSRLTFSAPIDGRYLVRVSDVRGFSGESFAYELTVRRPRPDFIVTVTGANPTVNAGGGKSFSVKAERVDAFNGPIRVDIAGLPPGFSVDTPLVIQAGHIEAHGVINALENAPAPTEANWAKSTVSATATIGDKEISHKAGSLGTIKLAEKPKLIVRLHPSSNATPDIASTSLPEVVIQPGATTTCKLSIQRNGFEGRVQFDVNNLPHGVIVDDIGLSGVLIPKGKTERTIVLKAAPWVPDTSRAFHAVAKAEGNQSSLPMLLHVRKPSSPPSSNADD